MGALPVVLGVSGTVWLWRTSAGSIFNGHLQVREAGEKGRESWKAAGSYSLSPDIHLVPLKIG